MSCLPIVSLNECNLWIRDVTLRQKCRPVNVESREELASAQLIIREMFKTLCADPSGVALAAPQIGVLLQITVINYQDKDTNGQHLMALINPQITPLTRETDEEEEICLSVPNFSGKVARVKEVKVEAYNSRGRPIKFTAAGFFARVIQHEVDHLNGILYVDKARGDLKQVPDYPERCIDLTMRQLDRLNEKEEVYSSV